VASYVVESFPFSFELQFAVFFPLFRFKGDVTGPSFDNIPLVPPPFFFLFEALFFSLTMASF